MKSQWLETNEIYDGSQLRSLFAYLKYGILGDSIVAWRGPCDVPFSHMVDGEDLVAQARICGDDMLHFIVEMFDASLLAAVGFQRLLAAAALDLLREKVSQGVALSRAGDDIYSGDAKLSISIATISPTSALIHFAVNVTNAGTPVKTAALRDWDLEPKAFAEELMQKFVREFESSRQATQKVRWVE